MVEQGEILGRTSAPALERSLRASDAACASSRQRARRTTQAAAARRRAAAPGATDPKSGARPGRRHATGASGRSARARFLHAMAADCACDARAQSVSRSFSRVAVVGAGVGWHSQRRWAPHAGRRGAALALAGPRLAPAGGSTCGHASWRAARRAHALAGAAPQRADRRAALPARGAAAHGAPTARDARPPLRARRAHASPHTARPAPTRTSWRTARSRWPSRPCPSP